MTYSELASSCIQDLVELQDDFQSVYNPDKYENWFYNEATGLLTFSTGKDELNFKYIKVGSFSRKSNTWKWSWDNEHTLPNVNEKIYQVREYGQDKGYGRLTEGYFVSSEEEAWELTAIAARLLQGIGVYRPILDHLLIFMILVEFVDNETAQNIKDKYVECGAHEHRRRAFVCNHLMHRTKVGFEEAFETCEDMELGEEDDFQAWCDECEKVRQKEDGWNDTSMSYADIRIVCEQCYFEMKEINIGHR